MFVRKVGGVSLLAWEVCGVLLLVAPRKAGMINGIGVNGAFLTFLAMGLPCFRGGVGSIMDGGDDTGTGGSECARVGDWNKPGGDDGGGESRMGE